MGCEMANRNTLSVNSLENFKKWLEIDGWKLQETKGDYEVLRAIKEGRKHPLIVYKRHETNGAKDLAHYTVLDRDIGVIRAYLKSKGE